VPYGPHLVLGSEASKVAAKKRKSDAIAGLAGKRVKVSSRKAAPLKASIASESMGAASSKAAAANVRNKPVTRASTGLITFGHGPAARVALVSVSELSPCPGRAAIEQLAPVYACVMGVCL
jgi:hypothetical protein